MIEGDVFRMIIKVPEFGGQGKAVGHTGEVTGEEMRLLSALSGEMKRAGGSGKTFERSGSSTLVQ